MAEPILCVTIDSTIREGLEKLMVKRGPASPDDFVNEALRIYIAAQKHEHRSIEEMKLEIEGLRRRIEELEELTRRKDDEITVLLKLWENCPINETEKARMERSPELEEKVARLLKNWYFESERKDHSGADV